MSNGVQEDELLELIENSIRLKNVQSYEKSKIQLILKFFKENNINTLKNITYAGNGTFSTVYKMNEFVIKIGLAKTRQEIIENPHMAKDFLRINIKFVTEEMTRVVGFEIQLFVQKYEKKCEDDLFKLYCSLRQDGLIWTDIKYANVGVLNDKLVVLDTDDIFHDSDLKINCESPLSKIFEDKYKKERRV